MYVPPRIIKHKSYALFHYREVRARLIRAKLVVNFLGWKSVTFELIYIQSIWVNDLSRGDFKFISLLFAQHNYHDTFHAQDEYDLNIRIRKNRNEYCIWSSRRKYSCDANDIPCTLSTMDHGIYWVGRVLNLFSTVREISNSCICDSSTGIQPSSDYLLWSLHS